MSDEIDDKDLRLPRDIFEYKAILDRINMPRWRAQQYKRILREIAEEMEGDASRCQAFLSPDSNRELDANSPFDMPDMGSFDNGYHYPGLTTEVAIEIYLRLMRRMHTPRYQFETIVQLIRDKISSKLP